MCATMTMEYLCFILLFLLIYFFTIFNKKIKYYNYMVLSICF